jgi:DNA-binding NtrC family response regulator
MHLKIYIVEDDPWYGQFMSYQLSLNPDYEVYLYTSAKDILGNLDKQPDLVYMDFGLPDMDGQKLLKEMLSRIPDLPVVVVSGQEDISVAVSLLKAGARDYIVKNDHTKDLLWRSAKNVKENSYLRREVRELKDQLEDKYAFDKRIIGRSDAIKESMKLAKKAIHSDINVSLYGETGTGKEVFAQAIHFNSKRRDNPFVAVNMSAIPKDLAESELFGHEKGAFTGAIAQKKGRFEDASKGTIFLDEIGDMDMQLQNKLLRVLQERQLVRVGGNKTMSIDIRLITATQKDLAEEVKAGNFREDLYFRIMGLPIELPPLRKRQQDILLLADHFIKEYAKQHKTAAPALTSDAKEKLQKHTFPGNVRELKAVIDLACVMCNGQAITTNDISFYQLGVEDTYTYAEKTLREYNNEIISHYLKKYNNDVVTVASKLDVSKSKIYELIKTGQIKTTPLRPTGRNLNPQA